MDSNEEDSAVEDSKVVSSEAEGGGGDSGDDKGDESGGSDDNEEAEENEDDDGDQEEASHDETSGRSGSGESSDDDDGDDGENPDGLSRYERLRLERIKRNEERLIGLGLLKADGHGTMVRGEMKKASRRKRTSFEPGTAEPKRRSGRSRESVNYNENALLSVGEPQGATQGDAAPEADRPKKNRRKEKSRDQRVPKDIYLEFKRIESHKKRVLKQAERDKRIAEIEFKHWEKKAHIFEKREVKRREAEKLLKQMEEERKVFGKTGREFLSELEGRLGDVRLQIAQYDARKRDVANQIETQARSIESEHKLKVLEALDAYPRAMKEAARMLNACLVERTPKDSLPPRRSKRKSTEDGDERPATTQVQKKKRSAAHSNYEIPMPQLSSSHYTSEVFSNAAGQGQESVNPPDVSENPTSKIQSTKKKREKREINVGGWISAPFAASIDRTWLEADKCASCEFNLKSYVPQIGDIVLYYPSGHRDFLQKFPDHLGGAIGRLPLWERARKERRQKATKPTTESHESSMDATNAEKPKQKEWWTDEWVDNFVGSTMMNYPLVCRVEKTQAEFPYDPNKMNQVVHDGQISYMPPETATKTKKKEILRLAVTLRSFTPVIPPKWTESGPVDDFDIDPPPWFTAVTFPTSEAQPYLIPFCWAYLSTHSLSPEDEVNVKQSKAMEEGNVYSFSTLEGGFGTFRLADKACFIGDLLTYLEKGSPGTLAEKVETSTRVEGRGRAQQPCSMPLQDVNIVLEFMSTFAESDQVVDSPCTRSKGALDFKTFLRSTLPLWNSVCLIKSVYDRRTLWVQPWELRTKGGRSTKVFAGSERLSAFMKKGVLRSLDDMLRLKIECTLEDFLLEYEKAESFRGQVTDSFAPMYSCAVPVSTSFERVLKRLKRSNKAGETEATCYYRSYEHCIQDINAIELNCMLYNAPDSAIVEIAHEIIPVAKRQVSNIVSRHFREREERANAGGDIIALPCNSSVGPVDVADGKKIAQNEINPFEVPFTAPLNRSWIQDVRPDGSAMEVVAQEVNCNVSCASSWWIPQAGDTILYSRSLHARFIEGHGSSLCPSQCVLPEFDPKVANKENDGTTMSINEIGSQSSEAAYSRATDSNSEWISGHIKWVRAVFPRVPSKKGDYRQTFLSDAPLLALSLNLIDNRLLATNIFVVYWRPCVLPCDGVDQASPLTQSEVVCKSCGVPVQSSFVCPGWTNILQGGTAIPKPAMPLEDLADIDRCLCLLKRRCLTGVPPDYVDENLTSHKVKRGYLPKSVSVRKQPTFEAFLKADCATSPKAINTRGILPNGTEASLPQLANINYLPPWLSRSESVPVNSVPCCDALSPCPNLCLELVLLRLQNGYYRHKTAIQNDIIEAYVNSVLLLFRYVATRNKSPISTRRIARALCTWKKFDSVDWDDQAAGNSRNRSPYPMPLTKISSKSKASGRVTATINLDAEAVDVIVSKNLVDNTDSVHSRQALSPVSSSQVKLASSKKESKGKEADLYTNEERYLLARISSVRRLYATAFVSISETTYVKLLFGLTPLRVCRQSLYKSQVDGDLEDEQGAVREELALLLAAISKDYGQNRIHLPPCASKVGPTVKVKFTCGDAVVKSDPIFEAVPELLVAALLEANTSEPQFEHVQVDPENGEKDSTQILQQPSAPIIKQALDEPPAPTEATTTPSCALASDVTQGPTIHDGVELTSADYEKNEPLMRLLFGRPGRMKPCARCQVAKKSMLYCRVLRGHSNADFDIMSFCRGMESLEDRLRFLQLPISLPKKRPPGLATTQGSTAETTAGEPAPTQDAKAKETKTHGLATKNKAETAYAVAEPQNLSSGANHAESDTQKPVTGAHEEVTTVAIGSQKHEDGALVLSNPEKRAAERGAGPGSPGDGGKDEVDPREFFSKAKSALALAEKLLQQALAYAKADARLSQEFVDETIPFDKADNHYMYCVICGLDGEKQPLLLCEGCHNVAHHPCVGLDQVPSGDWYCDICVAKKKLRARATAHSQKARDPDPIGKAKAAVVAKETLKSMDITREVLEAAGIPTFDDEEQQELALELDELFTRRTGKGRGVRQETAIQGGAKRALLPAEPESQNDLEICIGTKFVKAFEQGDFAGVVIGLPTEASPYYHVKYEDDDEEELTKEELMALLPSTARKDMPRKRGRPKKQSTETIDADVPEAPGSDEPAAQRPRLQPQIEQPKANSKVEEIEVCSYVPQFSNGKN